MGQRKYLFEVNISSRPLIVYARPIPTQRLRLRGSRALGGDTPVRASGASLQQHRIGTSHIR